MGDGIVRRMRILLTDGIFRLPRTFWMIVIGLGKLIHGVNGRLCIHVDQKDSVYDQNISTSIRSSNEELDSLE